jgi:omega-amidase
MQDLNVTLVQTDPVWEDHVANLSTFDKVVDSVSEETDLFIFPEMFTTGFSVKPVPIAEEMTGAAVTWMKKKSAQTNVDIVGSLIIKEAGCYFNRLVWAKPDGNLFTYDKRHLFRMAEEDKEYTAGNKLLTIELKGWRIRPFVCYDLRFPAWTRNIDNQYDVAVFVANWPEPRSAPWKTLLKARAIENLCYVIGVNRVGVDGNGLSFSGDSMVVNPLGDSLVHMERSSGTQTVRLSYEAMASFRRDFPTWMDADKDMIQFP